ncbi:hypothetical protein NO2_0378 [Candidatus Termititenax persephonae]|uniref:Uncharacterized protein n=1 Tax=Candidatus Termititenax persephonae TaxID=2218525 RepID=A0A388TFB1_9BACT|nr:hypothetical protein NO2_0378 [Candidatus Termititenax persephonae]
MDLQARGAVQILDDRLAAIGLNPNVKMEAGYLTLAAEMGIGAVDTFTPPPPLIAVASRAGAQYIALMMILLIFTISRSMM